MFLFNTNSQEFRGILIENHISVQAAAKFTAYNIQYLRRLLRAGKLVGTKIGQVWLIKFSSLEAYFKKEKDHRIGVAV